MKGSFEHLLCSRHRKVCSLTRNYRPLWRTRFRDPRHHCYYWHRSGEYRRVHPPLMGRYWSRTRNCQKFRREVFWQSKVPSCCQTVAAYQNAYHRRKYVLTLFSVQFLNSIAPVSMLDGNLFDKLVRFSDCCCITFRHSCSSRKLLVKGFAAATCRLEEYK